MFSGHTRYTIASLSVLSSYLSRYPLKIILPIYLVALFCALFAMFSFLKVHSLIHIILHSQDFITLLMYSWLYLLSVPFGRWSVKARLLLGFINQLRTSLCCQEFGFPSSSGWMLMKRKKRKWRIHWCKIVILHIVVLCFYPFCWDWLFVHYLVEVFLTCQNTVLLQLVWRVQLFLSCLGLPSSCDNDYLYQYFQDCGEISDCRV